MDLITISQREITPGQIVDTVNARDIWIFLEVGKDFSSWIKTQIERGRFVENIHFVTENVTPPKGGMVRIQYHLTLGAGKKIGMMSDTDRGDQVRDYFLKCEEIAASKIAFDPLAILRDPTKSTQLILAATAECARLTQEVAEKNALIEEQQPKVDALDRLMTHTEGSLTLRQASRVLQMPERKFIHWMEDRKWIYKDGVWQGYAPYRKDGYLEHKITTIERPGHKDKEVSQVRVTAKGLAKLATLLSSPQSAS